jgi:alpha-mannosidase
MRVPAERGASGEVSIVIVVRLRLDAESPVLHVVVEGENRARDHRLRLRLRTSLAGAAVYADAAFGPVRRDPLVVPAADAAMETPPPTAPLHRYVSLFGERSGATIYSDGLAEYEASADGSVAVTLVRAVGELSRTDLPERPGHAGWPAHTPEAQCIGPFGAHLAVLLHGPRTDDVVAEIERVADDVLLPLAGDTLRSALAVPAPVHGARLDGPGLAFRALKDAETGDAVVARCVNLLDREVEGRWTFGVPIASARLARLDETQLGELAVEGTSVAFTAGPRAVVTLLVRLVQAAT